MEHTNKNYIIIELYHLDKENRKNIKTLQLPNNYLSTYIGDLHSVITRSRNLSDLSTWNLACIFLSSHRQTLILNFMIVCS